MADDDGGPGSDGSVDDTTSDPFSPQGGWINRALVGEGARQETGVAALAGEVWVLGGFAMNAGLVPRLEAYDPARNSWRTAADFPDVGVHHANMAATNGQLWVAGYLAGLMFEAIGDTWAYDPAADQWTARSPMPAGTQRGASGVAVIDDRIYVLGGLRSGAAVDDAWAYDTSGDTWMPLPPLPQGRDHLVAAGVSGKIYAIGGRSAAIGSHTDAVDIFDPAAGSWSAGAPMPTSRGGMAAAVIDRFIFVAGGEGNPRDPSGVFAQLEAYDTEADEWVTLDPMPTPRHGTGGAAIDGIFYVPGGADVEAFGAVATHEAWVIGG